MLKYKSKTVKYALLSPFKIGIKIIFLINKDYMDLFQHKNMFVRFQFQIVSK
jgi:hypothetical protein